MKNLAAEKFQLLLQANQVMSSTLVLSDLLRSIMKLATEVVDAETSSILIFDHKTNELVFDLALTDKESELKEIRLKLGEGIAGQVAKEKKAKIVNDIKEAPYWAKKADDKTAFHTRAVLAVPLIYKGKLLGVVEAVNKKDGKFVAQDANILEAFAAQAAVSIENARLFSGLQEEKEKMQAMFFQMSDGAVFLDAVGNIVLSNIQAEKLLGKDDLSKVSAEAVFSEYEVTPPISDLLETKEKSMQVEFKRKSGKSFYLSGIASKILDTNNNPLGFILIFRDSTTEKKEIILKASFLSFMSHKLRTPLVTIVGYGPLLLRDATLSDFQRKAIECISRQGSHLTGLVDKLLYFTIIEGEKVALNMKKEKLYNLVRSAVSSLEQLIEQSKADIEVGEGLKGLPLLNMDNEKIEAVIRNLVENAIKFNVSEKKHVEITSFAKDGYYGIMVKDNGPGIPPEEREKVFQKFYQIEESFTGQVEGAGLGLALVKQIVEAHGGTVGLNSKHGKGSEFYFLLPDSK